MKLFWMQSSAALLSTFVLLLTVVADDCQPATWVKAGNFARANNLAATSTTPTPVPSATSSSTVPKAGEINCRSWGKTYDTVNYYTCTEISNKYQITTDFFFSLNPTLKPDCSNIKPQSRYCVDGFVEPLRATDGLCGPKHNNATCLGTDLQCCNAETFKCGQSTQDCADGTCFEGACLGDKVYSTDGTCGSQHGSRRCAGKWGDCCNFDGKCGTGDAFCGTKSCQSGNCTVAATPSQPASLPWQTGTTPDGSCGGTNKYTCNVLYGNCCNKNGQCGSLPVDCGAGCQSAFGTCG
ncbi:carbohydrate-binding module family 18 protein [Cucurbitaria berberidis CBS 394.84]|uniref:Carbohydrate-binding module family 18 protein n=1 Tax=Cucurbitaria berberidis CBS 394.84 TaxID=1168544 RepID=A0A9P4GBR5_9PLEO|nr:carbohydrate-binding module family 18 protein [Cucurbitaria berberidis CBS 394.84]KAF1842320.1 carbohydrate-binding module family 18 protein [Cucurbitaria berberidis CBS 394.84]